MEAREAFAIISAESVGPAWPTLFLRGVFSGWLIAMMVWLLPGADSARVWVIVMMTYLVALAGLAHIIVGSAEVFYLAVTGAAPWSAYFGEFLLPVLLGNIIGGITLVAVVNHAQVMSDPADS